MQVRTAPVCGTENLVLKEVCLGDNNAANSSLQHLQEQQTKTRCGVFAHRLMSLYDTYVIYTCAYSAYHAKQKSTTGQPMA